MGGAVIDPSLAPLFLSLATFISSLAGLVIALRNQGDMHVLHRLVNGQSEALNTLTAKSSYAQGQLHGPDDPKERKPPGWR